MMDKDPSVLHKPAEVILVVLSDEAKGIQCLPILEAEDFIRMHGELSQILVDSGCDIRRLRNRCGEKLANSAANATVCALRDAQMAHSFVQDFGDL